MSSLLILNWKIENLKLEKLAFLNPCIIVTQDSQSTISNKAAFSNTFNRVNSHVHTIMIDLIFRLGI